MIKLLCVLVLVCLLVSPVWGQSTSTTSTPISSSWVEIGGYDDIVTTSGGDVQDVNVTGSFSFMSFCATQTIASNTAITGFKIYMGVFDSEQISSMVFKIFRRTSASRDGDTRFVPDEWRLVKTYEVTGQLSGLAGQSAGIREFHIENDFRPQPGDFVRVSGTLNTSVSRLFKFKKNVVHYSDAGNTTWGEFHARIFGYRDDNATGNDIILPIKVMGEAPDLLVFGASFMSGNNAGAEYVDSSNIEYPNRPIWNDDFGREWDFTNREYYSRCNNKVYHPEDTIGYHVAQHFGWTYMNMGWRGSCMVEFSARLQKDVINRMPKVVIWRPTANRGFHKFHCGNIDECFGVYKDIVNIMNNNSIISVALHDQESLVRYSGAQEFDSWICDNDNITGQYSNGSKQPYRLGTDWYDREVRQTQYPSLSIKGICSFEYLDNTYPWMGQVRAEMLSSDSRHPSPLGHATWGKLVAQELGEDNCRGNCTPAYKKDDNFRYTVSNNEVTITKYIGSSTTVTIPAYIEGKPVSNIDSFAFSDSTNLESIAVAPGNDFYSGYDGVLYNKNQQVLIKCPASKSSISSFPANLTSIGDYAFFGCTSLQSVSIPDTVTDIGIYAFYKSTGLTTVNIPATVNNIGRYAFFGCAGLTSTSIGSGVTSIGEFAFYGCTSLTGVTIPESVTSIGSYAFYGCTGLTRANIYANVTSIGDSIFYGCTDLSRASLGKNVGSIFFTYDPFQNCPKLTYIDVLTGSKHFSTWNGILLNQDNSTIILCPQGKSGDLNNIPTSVTSIGPSAFLDCTGLTGIIMPNSVTIINEAAFQGCTGLTSITISENVTIINQHTFEGCTGLTSVIIPRSVAKICAWAFYGCTELTSVTFADSATITCLGQYAFSFCTKLESVSIPASITGIKYGVFQYCTKLKAAFFYGNAPVMGGIATCDDTQYQETSKVFDNCSPGFTVYYIDGKTGFTNPWHGYQTASFNGDFTYSLSNNAFTITGYLGSGGAVVIPETINTNPVVTIGISAFMERSDIISVTIPSSVIWIRQNAFSGCTNLNSVQGMNNVTKIGNWAFGRCRSLTSLTIPSNVTTICYGAFMFCTGLTSTSIGSGVTSIGSYAFYGCTSLTGVTIPESVTSIGRDAFNGCNKLTGAYFYGDAPSMGSNVFLDCASGFTVYYLSCRTGFTNPWYGYQTAVFTPPGDSDGDGISDACDNCPNVCNAQQLDANNNGIGDVCDTAPECGGCGQPACETACTP